MKYQKSPIPFVIILILMIIGLPMADSYFQSDLELNKSINRIEKDNHVMEEQNRAMLAVVPENIIHSIN